MNVLKTTTQKARKDYECASCLILQEYLSPTRNGFSFSEWRDIVKAKQNGWKIKKGEIYGCQVQTYEGTIGRVRYILAIHDICCNHDLYLDW